MVAIGTLFIAGVIQLTFLESCDATRFVATTFVANQTTEQPRIGSRLSFMCRAVDSNFFHGGDVVSFYKRQTADAAWVKIVSGKTPSTHYQVTSITQTVPNEINSTLIIDNFQATDVGTYLCNVNVVGTTDVPGISSANITVGVAPQPATVSVTSSAAASQAGAYLYGVGQVTTTCTVHLVSEKDVQVKVLYSNGDHTGKFSASTNLSWMGSVDALREPRRRITLESQTFKPVSRTPLPVQCIAMDQDSELGRGNITVALNTVPRIECVQSGPVPAYLNDLDVMITCQALEYDWNSSASRLSWSFTFTDGGALTDITLDNASAGKADRRIVSEPKGGKFSLVINKVTSDIALYTVYNISLWENGQVVLTTPFILNVLNKRRSSDFGSSSAVRLSAATTLPGAVALSLALVDRLTF